MRRLFGILAIIATGTVALAMWGVGLQAQVQRSLAFGVASVKPNHSEQRESFSRTPTGITYLNVTLQLLLLSAFGLRDFQIVGGPNWLTTDRFDVIAKAPEGTIPHGDDISLMLQSLLIDRFNLVARLETKPSRIYALTMVKPGMLGKNLHPNALDCNSLDTPTTVRRDPKQCELRLGYATIDARGWPLEYLTDNLAWTVGRPIVDRTGLSGAFDFSLRYNRNGNANSADPSLLDALEQQLGLKLESATGQVQFLTIEKASQPTPN